MCFDITQKLALYYGSADEQDVLHIILVKNRTFSIICEIAIPLQQLYEFISATTSIALDQRASACVNLPDGDVTHPRMHRDKCKQRHFGRIDRLALLSKETLLFYNGRQLLCTRVPQQEGASERESNLQATKR